MAILVLLALLGLGMMIATRGERQKIVPQRESLALETIMDRTILIVRERLRDDLVSDPNVLRDPAVIADPCQFDPNTFLTGDPNDPNMEGEPYDAPCIKDQWLASTVPWALKWQTGSLSGFVWHRVSYLGGDANDVVRSYDGQVGDIALSQRATVETSADPNEMLFDADGDGIPDSPISFTFPVDSAEPTDRPRRVHVAIRIVDNCSKINVCTAGLNDPGFERRGRLINDIVFDPNVVATIVSPTLDDPNFLRNMTDPNSIVRYRYDRLPNFDLGYTTDHATDPNLFYAVIRGPLFLGGASGLYSPHVETELTRRNVLISAKAYLDGPTTPVESSFPNTLAPEDTNYVLGDPELYQWRRLDDPALCAAYMCPDIYPPTENSLHGIFRRSLYTTRSFDVLRRGPFDLPSTGVGYYLNGQSTQGVGISDDPNAGLRWQFGMEKFDLNYAHSDDPNWVEGLANYLYGGKITQGPDVDSRLRSAYQLALNIVDYRDPDDEPTVLTSTAAPTRVAFAGIEQQPFLTEGYALWAAAGDPVVLTKHVAVEVFLPAGWLTDSLNLDRLLLKTDGADAIKLSDFSNAPQLAPGEFHVFANVADPAPPGLIEAAPHKHYKDTFDVLAGGVNLLYDPDGAGPIEPYPIDHLDDLSNFWTDEPTGLADGEWQLRTMQRNTNQWRFTVGTYKVTLPAKEDANLPSLGFLNDTGGAPLDTQVAPCYWWFKNLDWPDDPHDRSDPNRMAFDSPGDLSRLLAVGNDPNDPNFTTPAKLKNAQIYYRDTLGIADPNRWVAAGRLDFMLHDPDRVIDPNDANGVPTNVFDYFTTIAASADSIDNDGDGLIDQDDTGTNQTESGDIDYRVPGRININTASEFVLRTVPFFYDDPKDLSKLAEIKDLAAGIVTFREARPVPCLTAPGFLTTPPPKGDWFRTLGDLTRVRTLNTALNWTGSQRSMLDYWGTDKDDLDDLPDYDAKSDPTQANALDDDVRERDILLARSANLLTVRSDTYTVYIALIDSVPNADGSMRYLRRCQFTLDRINCFRDPLELPRIIGRVDTNYYDDTR